MDSTLATSTWAFGRRSAAYLQMSFISLGTMSSLSSSGIMAKPPTAKSEPPRDTKFRELRSWGKGSKSDHLPKDHTKPLTPEAALTGPCRLYLGSSLVGGDVVHLHGIAQTRVGDSGRHVDFVPVNGRAE